MNIFFVHRPSKRQERHDTHAFTLIEMIVSMALFSLVAVVALGALVRIMTANSKAQNLQAAMTNINSTLEAMAREMRLGTNYRCETSISPNGYSGDGLSPVLPNGCDLINSPNVADIVFISPKTDTNNTCNLPYIYRLSPDISNTGQVDTSILHFQKAEAGSCTIKLGKGSVPYDSTRNTDFFDVLDTANITLTGYSVGVGPYDAANINGNHLKTVYPYVIVRLRGYAGAKAREKEYFDVQTLISSRTIQK